MDKDVVQRNGRDRDKMEFELHEACKFIDVRVVKEGGITKAMNTV